MKAAGGLVDYPRGGGKVGNGRIAPKSKQAFAPELELSRSSGPAGRPSPPEHNQISIKIWYDDRADRRVILP